MGRDGRHDFDFLFGKWNGHQRRLRERLNNCTEWEEFESSTDARPILDGIGNVDEATMQRESGVLRGFTLRLYNPATEEWSLYWATGLGGQVGAPMVGRFDGNGRGEFYDFEPFAGIHIFSRFIWTVTGADTCRWEQAFSADAGKSWETNWTMDFTRS
ncbi:MAG: hypothetical protein ABI700_07735 [Chloroflexota bacterium]